MIEAVKVLEQAGVLMTYDDIGPRLGGLVINGDDNPFLFASYVHNTLKDVLPSPDCLLVGKGVDRAGNFVDYSMYTADEASQNIAVKFKLAFGIDQSEENKYSWQLSVNDCRPPGEAAWERVSASIHVLDVSLGQTPTITAWKNGLQGQWSEIEPRIGLSGLSALVMRLMCLPDVKAETKKHRADKAAAETKEKPVGFVKPPWNIHRIMKSRAVLL